MIVRAMAMRVMGRFGSRRRWRWAIPMIRGNRAVIIIVDGLKTRYMIVGVIGWVRWRSRW